jgi:hypothetical protein
MRYPEQAALRSQTSIAWQNTGINRIFIKFVLLAALSLAGLGAAQADGVTKAGAYVVGNDRGGFIRNRLIELRNLRASGRHVEIRGNICYSTCTMLLGLPQTCISPDTTFGFHGPSNMGMPLNPKQFEYYSQVIAQYYPAPLQSWYMSTGRKRIYGLHRIRGSEIIRMGIRAC